MTLYTQAEERPVYWPEPQEGTWQRLSQGRRQAIASKMPHLSLADLLFIAAVVNIPGARRPWGAITWLADVFRISRVSVYAVGERVAQGLQRPVKHRLLAEAQQESDTESTQMVPVTPTRLARTILTATFPGNVSIRPTQQLLQEALGQSRSVGFISQRRLESGRKAGDLLRQIDYSALGPVIVVRDETFFQGYPILMVIDPVSTTILLAQVCEDRQAETWGVALLMAQEQGTPIKGIIEDMARHYPKSQQLAKLKDVPVQKDPWHLQRDGARVRLHLEKAAYKAMRQVLELEKKLRQAWDEQLFEERYVPAVDKEAQLITQHDTYAQWLDHLYDAFELVDWRSGEIRDPETNAWLLEEVLTAMEQIDYARVRRFVKTLRNHQHQLLTFLDWTAAAMTQYRHQLRQHISPSNEQEQFVRTVARCWRLRQALINGHQHWKAQADQAEAALLNAIPADDTLAELATQLMQLLDAAGHTSSLVENINGILKSFLNCRQAFRNLETLQAYLDLFTLWHNMRVFERGKRKGKSPYQLAGIDPGCDDWLELLGYPAC
jgi:hypothetical protein